MYVPMGGNKNQLYIVWPIFIFVAFWHDLKIEMLVFGIGCSFLTLWEFLIGKCVFQKRVKFLLLVIFIFLVETILVNFLV